MKNVELKELVGGALQEQFGKAFERVVENLQNPNTPYKNSREITIKLKFTQNEQRDDVKCGISVTEKLAAQSPMETSFAIGKDLTTGELYAEEYGKQIRGQISMNEVQHEERAEAVAEELLNDMQPANVIDLRKVSSN